MRRSNQVGTRGTVYAGRPDERYGVASPTADGGSGRCRGRWFALALVGWWAGPLRRKPAPMYRAVTA